MLAVQQGLFGKTEIVKSESHSTRRYRDFNAQGLAQVGTNTMNPQKTFGFRQLFVGFVLLFVSFTLLSNTGCNRDDAPRVVIYTSVDQTFAQEILKAFEEKTGVQVEAVFDAEASKTTGFLNRLRRESDRPRCDVWWSSEVFTSAELANDGLLAPYESPAAADIPAEWKDPNHCWTAFAARARVIAYQPERIPADKLPQTWAGVATSDHIDRFALANPQFGTTRGHVGAMYLLWGAEATKDYLTKLSEGGVLITDGNAHSVRMVVAGKADWCATDTDDVWVSQRSGAKIELVYPKLTDEIGPMWIPNSVALIANSPHPETAQQLIDFLVSAEVERRLTKSDSRNIPVRAALREEIKWDGPTPQPLDFAGIAKSLSDAMTLARDILLK